MQSGVKRICSDLGCTYALYVLLRCKGLLILETYTTKVGDDLKLPDFLVITKEVTGDPFYSMFYLSLKE